MHKDDPIKLPPPHVSTDGLKGKIQDLGEEFKFVDFIYEKIVGKSVIDHLIAPLTGDFNRIRANGEAWQTIGQALRTISDNQKGSVRELRHRHWTEGAAAKAFQSHIERPWRLALYGAAQGCDWIHKGFDVLADRAIQVGQVAVDLLDKLLKVLRKILSKAAGKIGIIEDIISRKIPFKEEVEKAKELIEAILGLKDALRQLLESAKQFFAGAKMIANVLTSIPSVDSGHGAVDAVRSFREGTDQVQNARREASEQRKSARKHLDDIRMRKIG